ncbi:MAG: type I-E CRISPR-associated protein Cse2/CasB [Candidatus Bipolaricaulis sp.]|nr:type I-E CRISPR-associated protein Cse2/CasB [Candidatus Bipolaricaulis sp.]
MNLDDAQRAFVGNLLRLAEEGNENRGALADLRSGLGRQPGAMARVHRYVVPYLPDQKWDDRWYYATATLFGLFPRHRRDYSVGKAFGSLRPKSDSMETRFIALLNAHPDDLADHLRHVMSLLKSSEQPIDYFQLLGDLLQWEHPEGHVQLNWARDFYAGGAQEPHRPGNSESETDAANEEENDE